MSHGRFRQAQILMLAVMAMASPAAAQVVFDEGFDGPELASRWQWRAPVAGPTWSLTDRPGWLRLTVPEREGGYNHWVGADDAPSLLTALPGGDWDVETRLQTRGSGDYHAGLVVGRPPAQMLTLGPFFAAFAKTPEPQVWFEPTGHGGFASTAGPTDDLWLKLSRRGVRIEASLRRAAEADWQPLSHFSTLEPPTHAGLLIKTFGQARQVTLDADYFRVTQAPPAPAPAPVALDTTVRVDPDLPAASLDPMRLGQFIEHMARVVYGGMWAEMLTNRKFTGAARPTGVLWGWEPVGAAEGARYSRDNDIYYVPAQSQRLETTDAAEHGICQSGLELRAGVGLQGRIVARAEGLRTLTVSVRQGERVVAERQLPVGSDWTTLEFGFQGLPTAGRLADIDTLAVTAHGPGKLWIGCASLMPDDNVDGFRRDVLVEMKRLHIPSLRYPGGNFVSGYHWEDGVGSRDRRPPRWDRAWGAWEWNDMGTDEYFRLCRLLDCSPFIAVNAGEGTAAEAAAWVEYVNGAPDTPQGRRRAANGHREPFGCRLWSIGNEMYGNWQLGHLNATNYAIRAVEFARAMRAVDPSLVLVGVGELTNTAWNTTQAEVAGREIDYLSVHHYVGDNSHLSPLDNYGRVLATVPAVERALGADYEAVQGPMPAGKRLPLVFDEWNVTTNQATRGRYADFYALRDGLYATTMLNALIRLGDKVPGAHLAQTVNLLGAIRTDATRSLATPIALAFQLHASHSGPLRPVMEVVSPQITLPGTQAMLPAVDAAATMSADRHAVHLIMVNRALQETAPVALDLRGFVPVSGTMTTLSGPDFDTINTFEEPDAVSLQARPLTPGEWRSLAVPPHSAVAVTLRR